MQPDDTATMDENDEFMPDDDAEMDGDNGGAMKAGAEFMHGLNDILMQAFAFIEDGQGRIDNPEALKVADKVSGVLSKAKAALHSGYSGYKNSHPDQPDLLGADDGGMDDFSEDGDDLDDEDDLDLESDGGDETDDGDEKEKKPKKKKSDDDEYSKRAAEWRTKCLNSYWEHVKRDAVIADYPTLKDAIETLTAIRDDKSVPRPQRIAAKSEIKSLEALLVTKEAKKPEKTSSDDEWNSFFAELNGTVRL